MYSVFDRLRYLALPGLELVYQASLKSPPLPASASHVQGYRCVPSSQVLLVSSPIMECPWVLCSQYWKVCALSVNT